MTVLRPSQQLRMSGSTRNAQTLPVDLDPLASEVALAIPLAGWAGKIRTSLVVEHDGVAHRCEGTVNGGEVVDARPGREGTVYSEYRLWWQLPTGFFARGNEPPEEWAAIRNKRWGETAKASYRAWVELERIGTGAPIATSFELHGEASAAPDRAYHSSVAYQNAASAGETAGGDGTVSVSFTAGSGTDRVAFVQGSVSRDTIPTAASVTYGGSISSNLGSFASNTYWRQAGGLAWDALIDTGAKTVQFTSSGGAGSWYASYVGVISVTGAHQTTHGTVATNGADTGTALTCNVATPASDSLICIGWNYYTQNGGAGTPGADQTERTSVSMATNRERGYWETQPGSAGTAITHTKSHNNYEWVGMAIEIKAATTVTQPYYHRTGGVPGMRIGRPGTIWGRSW